MIKKTLRKLMFIIKAGTKKSSRAYFWDSVRKEEEKKRFLSDNGLKPINPKRL